MSETELQQLRSTLNRMAQLVANRDRGWFDSPRQALVNFGLPDDLVDWVLE